MTWSCDDCGWEWPYPGEEPWAWAECDSCGGTLDEERETQPLDEETWP